ncbi:MAG: sel1 repeat family protein, partial [Planctomycetes bacterium]|nr:sel1 repeat family protein [Planctomycetota bacterium]
MKARLAPLLLCTLLTLIGRALADEVHLTNGRSMRGEVLSKPGADPLVLKTAAGKVRLPRALIKEVVRDEVPRESPKPKPEAPGDVPESSHRRPASSKLLTRITPLPRAPQLPNAKQLTALLAKGPSDPRSWTLAGIVFEDGRGVPYDHERALKLYRRAAAAGDGLAMSRLASCFIVGKGVKLDYGVAKEWALAAADKKDPYGLALAAAWGWGVTDRSHDLGAERHLQAARRGELRSYYFVAKYKRNGRGFPRDAADSARWAARGAELGEPGCMDRHAGNLAYGTGITRDLAAAGRWAESSWSHGDAWGAVSYSIALRRGWGRAPQPGKAIEVLEALLRRPLNSASGAACYQLGQIYRFGWGPAVDFKKARAYMAQAFDYGYKNSIPALGYMYYAGQGGAKDIILARKLWELGAEKDNALSIRYLAYRTREGTWGRKDPVASRRLFLRAAGLGDSDSMYELGRLVYYGHGGPASRADGVAWMEKAMQAGHAVAANQVGTCYVQGWLGKKDLVRARRAFKRSSEGGNLDGASSYAYMLLHGNG